MLRKVEVLLAVEPESLRRLIQVLLDRPEFGVVKSLHAWPALSREARRLRPHLIIVNVRLLGHRAEKIIANLKFASPESKVIVISFPHDLRRQARDWGADAYLMEEQLVRRLVPTALKLAGLLRRDAGAGRPGASRLRTRASAAGSSPAKRKVQHFRCLVNRLQCGQPEGERHAL